MTAHPHEGEAVAMSGHSPEPWTYDEVNGAVVDANGNEVADCMPFNCDLDCADANGRRIASLAAENARLREALRTMIAMVEHIGTAAWENGNRAEFGMIDEGEALAAGVLDRARAALSRPEAP